MCYRDLADEQDSVLRYLEGDLKERGINIKNIKRLNLIDKEGTIYGKNFEDVFLVLSQNDIVSVIEAIFHAENRHVFFLFKHAEIYKDQFNKEPDELILLCYEIEEVTLEYAKIHNINVIFKVIGYLEID